MNLKYLAGVLIFGVFLIIGLSLNVSAIPYISIGNITHNFTVVPGQPAEITLPIMVKNASDAPIKGLQFNVTYNCSVINITNITHGGILDVPNANRTELYNRLCNGSNITHIIGLRKVFCFFMNTTLAPGNRTNASILIATIRNTPHPDICILRIAFASYKNLTTDAVIGRVKMKVSPMPNYFITNFTLPMNITVERMGLNRTVYVDVGNATIHSQVKTDGLIMACRGDATKDNRVDGFDARTIRLYELYKMNFTVVTTYPGFVDLMDMKECFDVTGDGRIDGFDARTIRLYELYKMNFTVVTTYPGFVDLDSVHG